MCLAGATPVTTRGSLQSRAICAAALALVAALFLAEAITALSSNSTRSLFVAFGSGLAGVVTSSLAVRSLASRVEVTPEGLELYFVALRRVIRREDVDDFVVGRFNGWDVALVRLRNGREVRLPLLAQPSGRHAVSALAEALREAIRR